MSAKPEIKQPEVTIDKLVYGGEGLGRLEGRVVLVPFVLPGETARVEIRRERPGLLEAGLLEIVAPAESRRDPPCPFFYRCGGCQYQHAAYERQLEAKRAILAETLRRVGKLEPPAAIGTIAGPEWGYRNRAQFHIAGERIGYYAFGSHELVAVDRCPISSPKINETLSALIEMLRDRRFPRFLRSLEVFTNETEVQLNVLDAGSRISRRFFDWAAERIPGAGAAALDYRTAGETYRVGYRSFFQVNRFLIDEMARCALEGAEGEAAVDLYAGVGLFSLPLARRFARVTAVEASAAAVRDLEFNAARAGVSLAVRHATADPWLASLDAPPDFVLADPPRAGLGKRAVAELLRLKPPRLAIVSCDPATLARDLAPLAAGGYRLEQLTLIDLFPQTFHIESVARLKHAGCPPSPCTLQSN